ncbi:MAG: polysaccharide deacetylase family protein [candidate division KSB1 bacterium]|nr:polysaccharide deacetylase family protein [candidate division KSB1 bacterium]
MSRLRQSARRPLVQHKDTPGWINAELEHMAESMVEQNTIDIRGTAADSVIITLRINDRIDRVTLPQDGKFQFNDIALDYGSNTISVLALDTYGHTKLLEKLTLEYGAPSLDYLSRNVTRGPVNQKQLALTFDGGAGDGAVQDILAILSDKNIKCTMFLTGRFLKRYPDQVRKILEHGHKVGNHTWSHPHLTTFAENGAHKTAESITRKTLQTELLRTAEKFKQITDNNMLKYWRAPFGEHNPEIRRWAAELGYTQIGWTITEGKTMDALDWVSDTTASIYYTSEQVLERLLAFDESRYGANGGIILMHLDTQRKQDPVHRILPAFIDSMKTRGYTLQRFQKCFPISLYHCAAEPVQSSQ